MKILTTIVLSVGLISFAQAEDTVALKVGDRAPSFELTGSDGKTYDLAEFKDREAVVIAWFPKAFTGG